MIIENKESYIIIKPTNNSPALRKALNKRFLTIEHSLSYILHLFAPILYLSIKTID